ncbi:MAG: endolytic transglycosylase MltG [Muribaculaceae bacterium]|nr:endolytic transglycosylase MltG [Muribaculaceae bacterium]
MKKIKIILISIAVLLVVAGGALFLAWRYATSSFDGEAPVRVNIPSGTDAPGVRAVLEDALGASFGGKVATLWERQGGNADMAHGSYLVEPGSEAIRVSRAILAGRQTPIRLTYNNIRTFGQLAARVGDVLELDSASFVAACDTLLPPAGYSAREQYAAAFLPDTYEFYWTVEPGVAVAKLLDHSKKFWNEERRKKAEELGLSPIDVATVASIVEEETNKADERPKVARLYLNRIAKGMPLQADPTVKFAVGDFSLKRLTGKHLAIESPYNTYKVKGLPPGPIRVVEASTIDAVLNAPEHKYLYMCAKSDFSGYHDFAETYDRHRINSARYHMALNRKGIR